MTQQQASLTLAVPLPDVERRLRDVTTWPRFLAGVESIIPVAYERYRFRLTDGREVPVAVRFHSRRHLFTWRALSGPPFDGTLWLVTVDDTSVRITLRLRTRPVGAFANLLEMVLASTSRAAIDLQRLDDFLHTRPSPPDLSPARPHPT